MRRKIGIRRSFIFNQKRMRTFPKNDRKLLMLAHGGEFTNDERTFDRVPDEASPKYQRLMESTQRRLRRIEKACMKERVIPVYETQMEEEGFWGVNLKSKKKKTKRSKPMTSEEKEIDKLEREESAKVAAETAVVLDSEENN